MILRVGRESLGDLDRHLVIARWRGRRAGPCARRHVNRSVEIAMESLGEPHFTIVSVSAFGRAPGLMRRGLGGAARGAWSRCLTSVAAGRALLTARLRSLYYKPCS